MTNPKFPFKGFKERPYSQDGLTAELWQGIPPSLVMFKDLWLPQNHLRIPWFFGERYSTDDFPFVVIYKGERYLEDGTHRVVFSAAYGGLQCMARKFILRDGWNLNEPTLPRLKWSADGQ